MGKKNNYYLDDNKVILFLDMDFYEVQIFLKKYPQYKNRPCAVIKKVINGYDNPRIVSVNALAKERKVTREDRRKSALRKCPYIKLFEQEQKYNRNWDHPNLIESDKILDVIVNYAKLQDNSIVINRDSNDGFYLDITEYSRKNQFQFNCEDLQALGVIVEGGNRPFLLSNKIGRKYSHLSCAAVFAYNLKKEILEKTEYQGSIGISYNPLLAKIGCELNKPDRITIIHSKPGITRIFKNLNINTISGFKAKIGSKLCEELNIEKTLEMRNYRKSYLINRFGVKKGTEVWKTARGIDDTVVEQKLLFNTVSCGRSFYKGINLVNNVWDLEQEVIAFYEKLDYDLRNKRIAKHVKIKFILWDGWGKTGKFDLHFNDKYDYNTIKQKIISEAKRVLNDSYFTKSFFTATEFCNIETTAVPDTQTTALQSIQTNNEINRALDNRHTLIDYIITEDSVITTRASIEEERESYISRIYEEFMRTNGHRLYVNHIFDY